MLKTALVPGMPLERCRISFKTFRIPSRSEYSRLTTAPMIGLSPRTTAKIRFISGIPRKRVSSVLMISSF